MSPSSRTRAYRCLRDRFRAAGLDTPDLDARLLVCHGLGLSPRDLVVSPDAPVSARARTVLTELAARRLRREPIARILGEKEFWGLSFSIDEHTLIPRPDSETLVGAVLKAVAARHQTNSPLHLLDIGTGSGCLLIALLSELHKAHGTATDIGAGALERARANAARHGVSARCRFIRSDWLAQIQGVFDIIVCNPPYIATGDIAGLSADVRDFEPVQALDGGADGLAAYRHIAAQLYPHVHRDSLIFLEHGAEQNAAVIQIFNEMRFTMIEIYADLGKRNRVICLAAQV